jgi:hypothetical protein
MAIRTVKDLEVAWTMLLNIDPQKLLAVDAVKRGNGGELLCAFATLR